MTSDTSTAEAARAPGTPERRRLMQLMAPDRAGPGLIETEPAVGAAAVGAREAVAWRSEIDGEEPIYAAAYIFSGPVPSAGFFARMQATVEPEGRYIVRGQNGPMLFFGHARVDETARGVRTEARLARWVTAFSGDE